jgi:hypothetical protein
VVGIIRMGEESAISKRRAETLGRRSDGKPKRLTPKGDRPANGEPSATPHKEVDYDVYVSVYSYVCCGYEEGRWRPRIANSEGRTLRTIFL